MKLSEMVSEPDEVECDPCRLLTSGMTPFREIAEEVIQYPGGTIRISLVEDEETGLVTRQFRRVDGTFAGDFSEVD